MSMTSYVNITLKGGGATTEREEVVNLAGRLEGDVFEFRGATGSRGDRQGVLSPLSGPDQPASGHCAGQVLVSQTYGMTACTHFALSCRAWLSTTAA